MEQVVRLGRAGQQQQGEEEEGETDPPDCHGSSSGRLSKLDGQRDRVKETDWLLACISGGIYLSLSWDYRGSGGRG